VFEPLRRHPEGRVAAFIEPRQREALDEVVGFVGLAQPRARGLVEPGPLGQKRGEGGEGGQRQNR